MTTATFERVYLWERPVRTYHWITVLCMLVLIPTGFLIGSPPAFMTARDASAFWFGWVRFLHFAAAYAFTFIFLVRVYWMFMGNRYARWENFLPFTPKLLKQHAKEAVNVVKVDILQLQAKPVDYLGHNALAAASYLATFAATIFQIVTGFALYAAMSGGWFPHLFAWIVPLMGGDQSVRYWHHLATWFFVLFSLIHIHLAIYHDIVEGHGEISSMFSGVRFHQKSGHD